MPIGRRPYRPRSIEPAHGRARTRSVPGDLRPWERGGADPLTEREREILGLFAEGFNGTEIAYRIGLSYATLNSHMRTVRLKLGVHTTTGAVVEAWRRGEIELPGRY